jgi:sigma-E factor negative regulatory protein RseA
MKTRISELMDGELDERAARELIGEVGRGGEPAEAWRTYHLIGDAMRGARPVSAHFAARVAERLAAEPAVLAPRRREPAAPARAWLPMALAASLAAVTLVGWVAFAPPQEAAVAPVAETQPAPAQPVAAATPIPLEANDYLLAHQVSSPRGTLQGMAPYVRSVSSER